MKKKAQGFLAGLATACLLLICIPIFAETIAVTFNPLNIAINGKKVASEGENFVRPETGASVPYSIVYKGTTYVPLKILAEFTGKKVTLDPVSNTVYLDDPTSVANNNTAKEESSVKENPLSEERVSREKLARFIVESLGLKDDTATCDFKDVPESSEYYHDIAVVIKLDIMQGYQAHFGPRDFVTRYQFASTMCKALGIDISKYGIDDVNIEITDLPGDNADSRIARAAVANGIMTLLDDGSIGYSEPMEMDLTPNPKLKELYEQNKK